MIIILVKKLLLKLIRVTMGDHLLEIEDEKNNNFRMNLVEKN